MKYMEGVVIETDPKRNAVIIDFHDDHRIVSIECVDYSKQKELEALAFELIGYPQGEENELN